MIKKELHIKHMVCPRCVLVVSNELTALGFQVKDVRLGHATVVLPDELSLEKIESRLNVFGFELLKEREAVDVEQIKLAVLEYLQLPDHKNTARLSDFISRQLGKNYNYLSKVFSKQEGKTIEKYFIRLRIEKAKELIDDGELNLSQIAINLGYSSIHYLSSQFKKVTGISMSDYKNQSKIIRKSLDKF